MTDAMPGCSKESESHKDLYFHRLPNELLLKIGSYLPTFKDILHFFNACQRFDAIPREFFIDRWEMNSNALPLKRVQQSAISPDALLIVYQSGAADFFEHSPFNSDLYRTAACVEGSLAEANEVAIIPTSRNIVYSYNDTEFAVFSMSAGRRLFSIDVGCDILGLACGQNAFLIRCRQHFAESSFVLYGWDGGLRQAWEMGRYETKQEPTISACGAVVAFVPREKKQVVRIGDVFANELIGEVKFPKNVTGVRLSPEGSLMAVTIRGGQKDHLHMVDVVSQAILYEVMDSLPAWSRMTFSADGNYLAIRERLGKSTIVAVGFNRKKKALELTTEFLREAAKFDFREIEGKPHLQLVNASGEVKLEKLQIERTKVVKFDAVEAPSEFVNGNFSLNRGISRAVFTSDSLLVVYHSRAVDFFQFSPSQERLLKTFTSAGGTLAGVNSVGIIPTTRNIVYWERTRPTTLVALSLERSENVFEKDVGFPIGATECCSSAFVVQSKSGEEEDSQLCVYSWTGASEVIPIAHFKTTGRTWSLSAGGALAFVAHDNPCRVRLHNAVENTAAGDVDFGEPVRAIRFSGDGQLLAVVVGGREGRLDTLLLLDVTNSNAVMRHIQQLHMLSRFSLSTDGRCLLVRGRSGNFKITHFAAPRDRDALFRVDCEIAGVFPVGTVAHHFREIDGEIYLQLVTEFGVVMLRKVEKGMSFKDSAPEQMDTN